MQQARQDTNGLRQQVHDAQTQLHHSRVEAEAQYHRAQQELQKVAHLEKLLADMRQQQFEQSATSSIAPSER